MHMNTDLKKLALRRLAQNVTNVKLMSFTPFQNDVDSHAKYKNHPKVFGDSVWPLISLEAITPSLLRQMLKYFKENIIDKKVIYDADDYHSHLAFLYITQNRYMESLNEIEKISPTNLHANLSRFTTFNTFLDDAKKFFPASNLLGKNGFYAPFTMCKENIIMLFLLRYSALFWDDIKLSDSAYNLCLNALQYASKCLEGVLKSNCISKGVYHNEKTMNNLIQKLQGHYPGIARGVAGMQSVDYARTPSDLLNHFSDFKTRISTFTDDEEKYGAILFLCKSIRNNSSHEESIYNRMFESKEMYVEYVSVIREGILMMNTI